MLLHFLLGGGGGTFFFFLWGKTFLDHKENLFIYVTLLCIIVFILCVLLLSVAVPLVAGCISGMGVVYLCCGQQSLPRSSLSPGKLLSTPQTGSK